MSMRQWMNLTEGLLEMGKPKKVSVKKPKQGILCIEPTADGDTYFMVDSKATFDQVTYLEDGSFNEADHWGGFKFNAIVDDEYLSPMLIKTIIQELNLPVMTMKDIKKHFPDEEKSASDDDDDEDFGDDDEGEVDQGTYQELMGEFTVEGYKISEAANQMEEKDPVRWVRLMLGLPDLNDKALIVQRLVSEKLLYPEFLEHIKKLMPMHWPWIEATIQKLTSKKKKPK